MVWPQRSAREGMENPDSETIQNRQVQNRQVRRSLPTSRAADGSLRIPQDPECPFIFSPHRVKLLAKSAFICVHLRLDSPV